MHTAELEEASTHKSAKIHNSTVFMPHDLELWPFDPKINGFLGLIVEHVCVKYVDPNCIVF